jgi:hypothetical protein
LKTQLSAETRSLRLTLHLNISNNYFFKSTTMAELAAIRHGSINNLVVKRPYTGIQHPMMAFVATNFTPRESAAIVRTGKTRLIIPRKKAPRYTSKNHCYYDAQYRRISKKKIT